MRFVIDVLNFYIYILLVKTWWRYAARLHLLLFYSFIQNNHIHTIIHPSPFAEAPLSFLLR